MTDKDKAIEAVANLSKEQVEKVLIFIAGLEAGQSLQSDQNQTAPTTT